MEKFWFAYWTCVVIGVILTLISYVIMKTQWIHVVDSRRVRFCFYHLWVIPMMFLPGYGALTGVCLFIQSLVSPIFYNKTDVYNPDTEYYEHRRKFVPCGWLAKVYKFFKDFNF